MVERARTVGTLACDVRRFDGVRIFVTGHTGFKGAWLVALLERLGAKVTGYSLAPPTTPSLFEEAGLASRIEHRIGDVRDGDALAHAMRAAKPEAVLHLAAQSLVLEGLADPVTTYATNVMGTVNAIEAIRATDSVRAAVVVTSDKCYEPATRALREGDPLGGHDPYSASKAAAEIVVEGYRPLLDPSRAVIATARAGNVIGGGDWADDRIVPDAVRACFGSKTLRLRHPDAVRPWQHVFEALDGYLVLAERACTGDRSVACAWNFGPSPTRNIPVRTLVGAVVDRIGATIAIEVDARPAPAESPALALDSGKAERELGWRAGLELDDVVAYTADWYRSYYAGDDALQLSRAQLASFSG